MRPSTVQPTESRRAGSGRPWALPVGRVAADLATDPVASLPAGEAAGRLARFGKNVLVEQGRKPVWRLLAEQFANTMIVVLLGAAVVAAVLGDLKDTVVILAILVLNGLLGFVQQYRAEQAMAALKAMTAPVVRLRRDGRVQDLPGAEMVPGDLVLLGPGDLVAADLRLTESWALGLRDQPIVAGRPGQDRQVPQRFRVAWSTPRPAHRIPAWPWPRRYGPPAAGRSTSLTPRQAFRRVRLPAAASTLGGGCDAPKGP